MFTFSKVFKKNLRFYTRARPYEKYSSTARNNKTDWSVLATTRVDELINRRVDSSLSTVRQLSENTNCKNDNTVIEPRT